MTSVPCSYFGGQESVVYPAGFIYKRTFGGSLGQLGVSWVQVSFWIGSGRWGAGGWLAPAQIKNPAGTFSDSFDDNRNYLISASKAKE